MVLQGSTPHEKPPNIKPPLLRSGNSTAWRSFKAVVPINTSVATSVLDHITNAEDIYDTSLFSTGSEARIFRPNQDWESLGLESLGRSPEGSSHTPTEKIDDLLQRWQISLDQNGSKRTPQQFIVLLDSMPSYGIAAPAFLISAKHCDDLVSTMKICTPFLPCLWTANAAPGIREFKWNTGQGNQRYLVYRASFRHCKR
ncbi:hypothetical protein F4678DRAFT_32696 [Xylaria arbuscula]|nr:hypothetical protein F4678DRAFT_32696 [Xylaria arbuscula]